VSYGVLDDAPIAVRNSDLIYRNLTWKGFGIDYWLATKLVSGQPLEVRVFESTSCGSGR
jgi:hypothetical protein